MRSGALRLPGHANNRRPPASLPGGRRSALRSFEAPSFGALVRWPGFRLLSRTAQAVLQHLSGAMDGRGYVITPAWQVAFDLDCCLRSVRSSYVELRTAGLILTTETRNNRGGTGRLCIRPGPVLLKLSPAPKKSASPPPSSSYGFRGAKSSPPYPVRGVTTSSLNPSHRQKKDGNIEVTRTPRADVDNSPAALTTGPVDGKVNGKKEAPPGGRRVVEPGRGSGSPPGGAGRKRRRKLSVSPGEILTASLEAALAGQGPLNDVDRRTVRAVAAIAVEHGAEREAQAVARHIGRVRWATAPGAVLRRRFIDALDDAGIGDEAVPAHWQGLRRSEAVRVDLRPAEPPPSEPRKPPAGQSYPDILPFRAQLRRNGVELDDSESPRSR